METKHQVHNLIILDESGSMDSIKKTIIQGFNEIVQTVKGIELSFPEQEHFISLVSFNGLGQKVLHFTDPVKKLEQIDDAKYQPAASTPLYDAMGFSFTMLRKVLEFKPDHDVLVTILTDGEENASKEYSGRDIKKMIEELKLNRWTFTYIGTDHDVEKFAASISITNTLVFHKNEADMKAMFVKEQSSRRAYSEKIRNKKNTNEDFYNVDNNKDVKA
ncbi:MAG: vWA domain-containing protein [Mariniphaga sp.]